MEQQMAPRGQQFMEHDMLDVHLPITHAPMVREEQLRHSQEQIASKGEQELRSLRALVKAAQHQQDALGVSLGESNAQVSHNVGGNWGDPNSRLCSLLQDAVLTAAHFPPPPPSASQPVQNGNSAETPVQSGHSADTEPAGWELVPPAERNLSESMQNVHRLSRRVTTQDQDQDPDYEVYQYELEGDDGQEEDEGNDGREQVLEEVLNLKLQLNDLDSENSALKQQLERQAALLQQLQSSLLLADTRGEPPPHPDPVDPDLVSARQHDGVGEGTAPPDVQTELAATSVAKGFDHLSQPRPPLPAAPGSGLSLPTPVPAPFPLAHQLSGNILDGLGLRRDDSDGTLAAILAVDEFEQHPAARAPLQGGDAPRHSFSQGFSVGAAQRPGLNGYAPYSPVSAHHTHPQPGLNRHTYPQPVPYSHSQQAWPGQPPPSGPYPHTYPQPGPYPHPHPPGGPQGWPAGPTYPPTGAYQLPPPPAYGAAVPWGNLSPCPASHQQVAPQSHPHPHPGGGARGLGNGDGGIAPQPGRRNVTAGVLSPRGSLTEQWECQACTYLHQGKERQFLKCAICGALR